MFEEIKKQVPRDALVFCDLIGTFYKRSHGKTVFTDLDGFISLWKHVRGKVIFLTAHPNSHDIHHSFKELGLRYSDFTILYTTVPKGEFLKRYRYPHIVFIDNTKQQILSVQKRCPHIQTFHLTKT